MDTFIEITCVNSNKKTASNAIEGAFKEIERIEALFNRYDEESEVSKINRLAGIKPLTISPEVFELIEKSLYYSRLSDGNFDITVAPVIDIWVLSRQNNSVPDDKDIDSVLKHVG